MKTKIQKTKKPKTQAQKKETRNKIIKLIIAIVILLLIFLTVFLILKYTGTLDKIDSAEELKDLILSGGVWSYFIFMFLQFLQVTLLPLPAIITTLAGTWVFGPWVCAMLSIAAVLLGSLFAFWLGKKLGKKVVVWIAGEEDAKKWATKLEKGKYVFLLMMIFPVFPDDILCMLVGTTNMSYKFFITTNLIARPISIISTCFLGSGQLIPYSGWGIPVWIVLIILGGILFYLSYKYQASIEKFVVVIGQKISNKFKSAVGYEDPELVEKINTKKQSNNVEELKQNISFEDCYVSYENIEGLKENNLIAILTLHNNEKLISEIKCYTKTVNGNKFLNLKLENKLTFENHVLITKLLSILISDIKGNKLSFKNYKFKSVKCEVNMEDLTTIKALENNNFVMCKTKKTIYELSVTY